jgi:predicted nucleic acid-binding protein
VIYLHTSAAVKALIAEAESDGVRRLLSQETRSVSSSLLALELHSVADRHSINPEHVEELLARVALLSLSDDLLYKAIALHSGLRSLDALHLATALYLKDTLSGILTFDKKLADAAHENGLTLIATN